MEIRLDSYSVKQALFWGNAVGHFKKAGSGSLSQRTVHVFIGAVESIPLIGQIISLFEKFLFGQKTSPASGKMDSTVQEPAQETNKSAGTSEKVNSVTAPLKQAQVAKEEQLNTVNQSVEDVFRGVNSTTPVLVPQTTPSIHPVNRAHFKDLVREGSWSPSPVVIGKSDFVPEGFSEHLMRVKRDSALGEKYKVGTKITNMEGALHTFVTPVCPFTIGGDHYYAGRHRLAPLPNSQGRRAILSAAVQPDFENDGEDEVIMRIAELKDERLQGAPLPGEVRPFFSQHDPSHFNDADLQGYEESLRRHMVHHLTRDHALPSKDEVYLLSKEEFLDHIKDIISSKEGPYGLAYKAINLNGHVISLEVMFNLYLEQIRNEFKVLNSHLPQGYIYTINPPAIFAAQIGRENVDVLNRLQALAFKQLKNEGLFSNMKAIGFADFADQGIVELYDSIFPGIAISSYSLYGDDHYYAPQGPGAGPYALVLHNNSDAFGQNIETEGQSSLDGVIGFNSDAAWNLDRMRPDLVSHVI